MASPNLPLDVRNRLLKNAEAPTSSHKKASPFRLVNFNDSMIASDLPKNDDEAEKRMRQIERVKKIQSENKLSPASRRSSLKSAMADFTDNEKDDHFNFCIKLSSENKITAKNAFALHLIDYFSDVVKKQTGVPNFQMASMSLQASTKIYAVRVDCLHADAMKMATGLHAKDDKKANNENEAVNTEPGEDDDPAKSGKSKSKKKAKTFNVFTLEKTMDLPFDTVDDPHEKFHFIKNIFDGSEYGGLLYQCSVYCDDCKIPFANAYSYCSQQESIATDDTSVPEWFDNVTDMCQTLNNDVPFAPDLDNFSFSNVRWPLDNNSILVKSSKKVEDNDKEEEETIEELRDMFNMKCQIQDSDNVEKQFEELFGSLDGLNLNCSRTSSSPFGGDNLNFSPGAETATPVNTSFRLPEKRLSTPKRCGSLNRSLRLSGSTIKSFRTSSMLPPTPCIRGTVQEEIGTLFQAGVDPIIDATMTGRPKKKTKLFNTTKRKKLQNKTIDFDDDELYNKIKHKLASGKKCYLSDYALKRWSVTDKLLPEITFNKKDFYKLFLLDMDPNVWLIKIGGKEPTLEERTSGFDHVHFCGNNDDDDEEDMPYQADEGCSNGFDAVEDLSFLESDLVPLPDLVKKDVVHYAKSSKNIDQKRVKATIWSIISSHYNEQKEIQEEETTSPKIEVPEKALNVLKFTKLYVNLLKSVPVSLREKLSIPVAFVSLLHLANEKNLEISSEGNMNDLSIKLSIMNLEKV